MWGRKDKPRSGSDFDHGGFWDQYSSRWDAHGDGDGVKHTGDDAVLGVEWTEDHRTGTVIEQHVLPFMTPEHRVLEIGPGGGKFSRILQPLCAEFTLADISPRMLKRASEACTKPPKTIHLDGETLRPLEDASLDMVFSYDVFIHLESEEVFRYFSEINRVLVPGGTFVVQTSTYESQYGVLSYLRLMRDHRKLIGQRYGGRMYPMSDAIIRRFAEHSGFRVEVAHGSWEDRDIVYTLRKTSPAWPWKFITEPNLAEQIELFERLGGSDRRELYAANFRKASALRTVLLGTEDDPIVGASAQATVPDHPCLAAPERMERRSGAAVVVFPFIRGIRLSRVLAGERPPLARAVSLPRMFLDLCDGVLRAHDHGLVFAESIAEAAILHVEGPHLVLCGLFDPAAAGVDATQARAADLQHLDEVLRGLFPSGEQYERLAALGTLQDLLSSPEGLAQVAKVITSL